MSFRYKKDQLQDADVAPPEAHGQKPVFHAMQPDPIDFPELAEEGSSTSGLWKKISSSAVEAERNKASLEARTFRTPPQPDLVVGSAVIYCRLLGTVQFVGETSLGPGLWAGIELKSKNGTNDGSIKSGRKSTRYFTCRKKYGIFARLSSLTLAPPPPTVVDGPRPMISRQFSMADVVEMATAAAKSKGDLKGKPEMYIYKGRPEDLRPLAVMQRLPAPMKYEPLEVTKLSDIDTSNGIRGTDGKAKWNVAAAKSISSLTSTSSAPMLDDKELSRFRPMQSARRIPFADTVIEAMAHAKLSSRGSDAPTKISSTQEEESMPGPTSERRLSISALVPHRKLIARTDSIGGPASVAFLNAAKTAKNIVSKIDTNSSNLTPTAATAAIDSPVAFDSGQQAACRDDPTREVDRGTSNTASQSGLIVAGDKSSMMSSEATPEAMMPAASGIALVSSGSTSVYTEGVSASGAGSTLDNNPEQATLAAQSVPSTTETGTKISSSVGHAASTPKIESTAIDSPAQAGASPLRNTWIAALSATLSSAYRIDDRCYVVVGDLRLPGTIRFVGFHHRLSEQPRIGVELDEAHVDANDGVFQKHRYFSCPANYGLVLKPSYVEVVTSQENSDGDNSNDDDGYLRIGGVDSDERPATQRTNAKSLRLYVNRRGSLVRGRPIPEENSSTNGADEVFREEDDSGYLKIDGSNSIPVVV